MFVIYLIVCLAIVEADDSQRPVLQELWVPRKLVENQTVRLNCDLIQGTKPIQFSWFFNDAPIRENEQLEVETRKDASSLMIKRLSVEQIGSYRCVASNDHGSDQQAVAVYVNSKRT